MRLALRFLALMVAGAAALAAQEPQRAALPAEARDGPARDFAAVFESLLDQANRVAVQSGTGSIRGRVGARESGVPLRRADVRLTSTDGRSTKHTATDLDGFYEFNDLPAGRYFITGSKAGYLTLQYGQRRPLDPGKPVELAAAQVLDKTDLLLPRGSVITGRIFDEFGEPVADATVQALRYQFTGSRRRLAAAGRADETDDIGQFRIAGLPPGEYFVTAGLRNPGTAALQSDDRFGYAPTYYPGTPSPSEAQRVTVGFGVEAPGINFSLNPARLARVSGTVIDSQGKPLTRASVMVQPRREEDVALLRGNAVAGPSNDDGTFFTSGLPPGDYVLQARGRTVVDRSPDMEFGSLPIIVNGSDIDSLVIVTSPGAAVTGRVTFGGRTAPPTVSAMRVTAVSTDAVLMATGPGAGLEEVSASIARDGMFRLRGLSGSRLFRIVNPPEGWSIKIVRISGVDVTDTPYEFKGGETISSLEIELTDRTTQLNGTVTGSRNERVMDFAIVVFPDDRKLWRPHSRLVRAARPDQEGRFQIRDLPPGRYSVIALDYLEQGSESDSDLLDRLKPNATSVTLDEGETQQLSLKLSL